MTALKKPNARNEKVYRGCVRSTHPLYTPFLAAGHLHFDLKEMLSLSGLIFRRQEREDVEKNIYHVLLQAYIFFNIIKREVLECGLAIRDILRWFRNDACSSG